RGNRSLQCTRKFIPGELRCGNSASAAGSFYIDSVRWRSSMQSQATLTELFRGRGAHADPLACVSDVTEEQAGRRSQGHAFSIYQIVWHLNFWMDYERRKIGGEDVSYPEHASLSWPSSEKPASASGWSAAIGRFRELIGHLESLSGESEDVLQR